MKKLIKIKIVAIFVLHLFSFLSSQTQSEIKLKNGKVIQGQILEKKSNSFIKVKTKDGTTLLIKYSDIEDINPLGSSKENTQDSIPSQSPEENPGDIFTPLSVYGGPINFQTQSYENQSPTADSQEPKSDISRNQERMKFNEEGYSKAQFNKAWDLKLDVKNYGYFLKGRKQRKNGKGLLKIGIPLMAVGLIGAFILPMVKVQVTSVEYWGAIGGTAGLGLTLTIIGGTIIRNSTRSYNRDGKRLTMMFRTNPKFDDFNLRLTY